VRPVEGLQHRRIVGDARQIVRVHVHSW
jgi:hypothetical protein